LEVQKPVESERWFSFQPSWLVAIVGVKTLDARPWTDEHPDCMNLLSSYSQIERKPTATACRGYA
jgi:hypothetical protein